MLEQTPRLSWKRAVFLKSVPRVNAGGEVRDNRVEGGVSS
jgi:hypothetical protein